MIEVVWEKVGEKAIKAKQRRRSTLVGGGGVGDDGVLGRGQVRFPCPAGPWGVVAADVTSGAPPLSLHLPFPLVWRPGRHVLACLQRRQNAPIHLAVLPSAQKINSHPPPR